MKKYSKKTQLNIYFILFCITILTSCFRNKKFDIDEWKSNPDERFKMARDIVKSRVLIGKGKNDVLNILTDDCKNCDVSSDSWMYYMRFDDKYKGRDMYIEVLDIEFKNDTVYSVSVRE